MNVTRSRSSWMGESRYRAAAPRPPAGLIGRRRCGRRPGSANAGTGRCRQGDRPARRRPGSSTPGSRASPRRGPPASNRRSGCRRDRRVPAWGWPRLGHGCGQERCRLPCCGQQLSPPAASPDCHHGPPASVKPVTRGPDGRLRAVSAVISVVGLKKHYGNTAAVDGIDLEIHEGEVFALLGPNGAGKTTTVEILEGFRDRTAGAVEVLGEDPAAGGRAQRQRIGIVLQQAGLEPYLTVSRGPPRNRPVLPESSARGRAARAGGAQREGRARGSRRCPAGSCAASTWGSASSAIRSCSSSTSRPRGSTRRPAAPPGMISRTCAGSGKTIVLTTHYMDEAQSLADRVAVIDGGVIVAEGTPDTIGGRAQAAARIRFHLPPGVTVGRAARDRWRWPTARSSCTPTSPHRAPHAHRLGVGARRPPGGADGRSAQPRGRLPRADQRGGRGVSTGVGGCRSTSCATSRRATGATRPAPGSPSSSRSSSSSSSPRSTRAAPSTSSGASTTTSTTSQGSCASGSSAPRSPTWR